ncbi:MAG: DUF4145 domain-containing protein [Rhodocyclaceae bacterium]
MGITLKHEVVATPGEEIDVACSKCACKTAHVPLVQVGVRGSEGDPSFSFEWHEDHQIIKCLGCRTLSYRIVSSDSEDYCDDESGNRIHFESEKLFPPRIEGVKGLGDETVYLPLKIKQIYAETQTALSVQAPVLAAIGLRALLETVCKEKEAEGTDLFRKIDSLVDKRVLTPAGATILHKIRTLGNAAAHEVKPHTGEQLALAMDIVEHVLKDVLHSSEASGGGV